MRDDDSAEDSLMEDTQWTAAARTAFASAGDHLLAELSAHIAFLSTADRETSWAKNVEIYGVLKQAAIAYADAQFDLTGNFGPFGILEERGGDEEDDDEDDDREPQPTSFVSVLQRADYAVLDEETLVAAARLTFLENRPGESAENAQSQVSHMGAALYELAHANGWDSLEDVPGLTPMGSIIQVLEPLEPIEFSEGPSETEEPDPGFSVGGLVLYTEQNTYVG